MPNNDFIIKFDGEQHQIDSNTLINSLVHTTNILQEINKYLDASHKIEIKIKAPEKGSFLLHLEIWDFVIENGPKIFSSANVAYAGTIIASLAALLKIRQHLKGEKPKSIEKQEAGNETRIENANGDTIIINNAVFNIYEKSTIVNEAISKNFDTLREEPAITAFEILDAKGKKLVEVDSEEFEVMSKDSHVPKEEEKEKVEKSILNIVRLSFEKNHAWEFYYRGNKIKAKIEDSVFQSRIDKGESFAKGDSLIVQLKIRQIWDDSVNTYINKSYSIVEIIKHSSKHDSSQRDLF